MDSPLHPDETLEKDAVADAQGLTRNGDIARMDIGAEDKPHTVMNRTQRDTQLVAASQYPPNPQLEDIALAWTLGEQVNADDVDRISRYIISCLATDVFASKKWLSCLKNGLESSRLKPVLTRWGDTDFEVGVISEQGG